MSKRRPRFRCRACDKLYCARPGGMCRRCTETAARYEATDPVRVFINELFTGESASVMRAMLVAANTVSVDAVLQQVRDTGAVPEENILGMRAELLAKFEQRLNSVPHLAALPLSPLIATPAAPEGRT